MIVDGALFLPLHFLGLRYLVLTLVFLDQRQGARDIPPRDALLMYAAKCTRMHAAEGICIHCNHGFERLD